MKIRENKNFNIPSWKISLNHDVLFLILDKSVYLLVLNWKEKLNQNYSTVCNLEIKKIKNIFKNINYYSPKLVVVVGKDELKTGRMLVKDWQKQQEFRVDKKELVSWVCNYLSKES